MNKNKIKIDLEKCVGCGLCATIAPQTFEIDANTGQSKVVDRPNDSDEKIKEAADNCPVGAIEIGE